MDQHVGQLESFRIHAPDLVVGGKGQRAKGVVAGDAWRGQDVSYVFTSQSSDVPILDDLFVHIELDEVETHDREEDGTDKAHERSDGDRNGPPGSSTFLSHLPPR